MTREPAPCSTCASFRDDRCDGYEKPRRADETNEACVLFLAKNAGRAQRPRRTNETISRASAATAITI